MTEYLTHDNGGRPFKVQIEGEQVRVFRTRRGREDDTPDLLVAEYVAPEIMIGRDGPNEWADGNSILLRIAELEYVFIGDRIFSFHALAAITRYASPVGNSNVPYPWAQAAEGHVYLMLHRVIMLNNVYDRPNAYVLDDPYGYYQRHARYAPADWGQFFLLRPNGDYAVHDLFFVRDPGENYEWYTSTQYWAGICIGTLDEKEKRLLTEQEYRGLIHRLGELKGLQAMNTVMIHDRCM